MRTNGERGFTLIEVMIAAAVGVFILGTVVAAAFAMTRSARHLDVTVTSHTTVEHLSERLQSEASSAWAVYVPANDATGASNVDGHAVAFYAQDGQHRSYGWQYSWNGATASLTRYVYDPSDVTATLQQAESVAGVTAFSATTVSVDELRSPQSPQYDALFAGATVSDAPFTYAQGAVGGNRLVAIRIAAGAAATSISIAAATAPSSFTIVVNYTPSPPPTAEPTASAPPAAAPQTPTPDPTAAPT